MEFVYSLVITDKKKKKNTLKFALHATSTMEFNWSTLLELVHLLASTTGCKGKKIVREELNCIRIKVIS